MNDADSPPEQRPDGVPTGAPPASARRASAPSCEPETAISPPLPTGQERTLVEIPATTSPGEEATIPMVPRASPVGRERTVTDVSTGLTRSGSTAGPGAGTPGAESPPAGRERTLVEGPAAPGGEATLARTAGSSPVGRERTVMDQITSLTGRELTLESVPVGLTGQERTLTETPATIPVSSTPPTSRAGDTPGNASGANKPRTRSSGTSVDFDEAWHLQGRKGTFTGQSWDDFDIGGILGEGGMGAVYRAKQRSLKRRVALKMLPPYLAADARLLERFRLEARTASILQSPHVVQVYAIGEHEGNHYFAMEFVEGTDLKEVMKAQREAGTPLTQDEAADYILQAAKGLSEAGRHGIVHRDIKPPNLMVTRKDNLLKIADFGIVKVIGEQHLTMTGQAVGTPAYVSPEQGRGAQEIDQRSDIYSLGVVFYELLCGKKPFEGTTPAVLIYQHCYDEPELPQKVDPAIGADYQAVVLKCLQKKPENRYQSADELIADLQAITTGAMLKNALANYKGTGADEARREQMNWLQRHLLPVALAAGLMVLAGGGAAYWYFDQQSRLRNAESELVKSLTDCDKVISLPHHADALLGELEKAVGAKDARVVRWREKIGRVHELEARLEALERREVDADLRAQATRARDELRGLVGTNDPTVISWTGKLDQAEARDQALRRSLEVLERQDLTRNVRDQLAPLLSQLRTLAPADDQQVERWRKQIAFFDARLSAQLERLAPLDKEGARIPREKIAGYEQALNQARPLLGAGDKQVVRWSAILSTAKGIVGELQAAIGARMAACDLPPKPLQEQITPDLDILRALTGGDDADVKRWDSQILRANTTIASLRQRLAAAFAPLAADDILPVPNQDAMRGCLGQLEALAGTGDDDVIRWRPRIEASIAQAKALDRQLSRLEPASPGPITMVDQAQLKAALVRYDGKGGIDAKRRQVCQERLAAEAERVAASRRELAVLDRPLPLTALVRERFARFATDVGAADPQVIAWRGKLARVDDLARRLAPLAVENALVPPDCQELYDALVREVGPEDALVGSFAQRISQVQQVAAALAPVDRVEPLPPDVAADLERSAHLFGMDDPVQVRRAAKVQRVAQLKDRLGRSAAAVTRSAADAAADRAAFVQLLGLVGASDRDVAAYARRLAELTGPDRPSWATDAGRDGYGLWADAMLKGQAIRFRFCPPGQVTLGSVDQEEGHQADELPVAVHITRGFWLAESECTQGQWSAVMGTEPSLSPGAARPVERVSFADVGSFLGRCAEALPGFAVRLPTEAEWEYACRAGEAGPWSAAQAEDRSVDKVAWYGGNADGETHEVKQRLPNPLGLYDMHGNVWEWCQDSYGAYPTSATDDWLGHDGSDHVVRGGSWGDPAAETRAARRKPVRGALRSAYVGFRIAVEAGWSQVPDGRALIAAAGADDAPRLHRIAAGETLAAIAKAHLGSGDASTLIVAANPWLDASGPLPVGVWLHIPPPGWRAHGVVAGETLSGIARAQCGDAAAVQSIAIANPWLPRDGTLRPGAWLLLPPRPAARADASVPEARP